MEEREKEHLHSTHGTRSVVFTSSNRRTPCHTPTTLVPALQLWASSTSPVPVPWVFCGNFLDVPHRFVRGARVV